MRDWRRLHRSFERLLAAYRKVHENKEVGIQLLGRAMNPLKYERADIEREAASFRVGLDLDRDWEELTALRDAFEALSNLGFSENSPAESVYQTAIQVRQLRLDDAVNGHGEARWFYRGQRHHVWDSSPKLLRGLRGRPDGEALLQEGLQQVRSIVARMLAAGIANDEFEAIAIAQHYSSEIGLGTWLLDVTRSPWVALFFASDGGSVGDTGKLEYIGLDEWMLFSDRGASALGGIRITSPDAVLRIRNQNAFFLQAPHPDLFADLSNRTLYFKQAQGLVFESDAFAAPIRRDFIYPREDSTLNALRALSPDSGAARKLAWEPTVSAFRAPGFEAFLPIARALLQAGAIEHDAGARFTDWGTVLGELCRLHAAVRARRDELGRDSRYVTTLHHLRRLVLYELVHGDRSIADFLNFNYLQYWRNDPAARRTFGSCLADASPFWAQVLEEEGPALGL